ncbi:hypothetical protein AWW67_07430 [Roseivirga seohaensis]|uniref:Cell division protein FtsX n=1 Tax=Roseivirga seohaensis TaxID=1914963 RepID=A0A150XR54_9BACT|nr:ABC transporter permease [Roseivirga seohaensis]KYG81181.1 hypothetical protein AWW67_07430 [Roseivirga seohaensis]
MFKNYFKIAIRTLWRSKGYAFINILGLAIGITGATLLLTYVNSERSFDKFHTNYERIVRPVFIQGGGAEGDRYFSRVPAIYARTLVDQLPEVEEEVTLTRLSSQFNANVNNVNFTETNYFITTSDVFSVFDFELLQGNEKTALDEPFSMVVTQSQALKFFGTEDVMGKTVDASSYLGNFKITGVMKDLPRNSHLEIGILLGQETLNGTNTADLYGSWSRFSSYSYLLLKENTELTTLSNKANKIAKDNMPSEVVASSSFMFQPLEDIHFHSANIEGDIAAFKGEETYSVIFTVIAIFLIVIAAVNYMNLATSKAVFRAKEIGIRKVVGAIRQQLIFQFLIESFMIAFFALVISVGITDLSMPFFNELTGRTFEFNWSTLLEYLPLLMGITLAIGLLSGIYPALFMTKFKPVSVLKGENVTGSAFNLRKALVVFQFVLSTVFVISTLVVSDQMNFIREKDLGFDKENLLVIDINNGSIRPVFKTMRYELEQIPGVQEVAVASRIPGEWKNINEVEVSSYDQEGEIRDSVKSYYMSFDPNMLSTFNIKLRAGEFFSGNDQSDSTKILINETAAKKFGLENPVGTVVQLAGRGKANYTIIGVLEDFNFQSLHTSLSPLVIGAWNNPNAVIDYFILKTSGNPKPIIDAAGLVHSKFDTRTVMDYHFLDNQLEAFYETEREANVIFIAGASLSIFIACLGLFGLASFTIQKRVKELGIRKILGSSQWGIFFLLSSSFAKQILLSFVIAAPIAYYIMNNWLENFEYRVGIGVGAFLLAGCFTFLVSMLTISYRTIKAVNSNPIDSLRTE